MGNINKYIKEIRDILTQVFILLLILFIIITISNHIGWYIQIDTDSLFKIMVIIGLLDLILYIPISKKHSLRLLPTKAEDKILHILSYISPIIIKNLKKVVNYLLSLSIGQIFVLVAIILLITASIYLAGNNKKIANVYAIMAYYNLLIGVLDLLVEYIVENKFKKLRMFAELLLLSIFFYITPEIKNTFNYIYVIPLLLLIIFIIWFRNEGVVEKLTR